MDAYQRKSKRSLIDGEHGATVELTSRRSTEKIEGEDRGEDWFGPTLLRSHVSRHPASNGGAKKRDKHCAQPPRRRRAGEARTRRRRVNTFSGFAREIDRANGDTHVMDLVNVKAVVVY
jgi:hypothetical protein